MSARDRETAVALARAAAALDGAVLGLGTAALAVASWVKYLSTSGSLRRIAAAPAVAIPDLRSLLAGEDGESRLVAVRGLVRAAPRGKFLVPPDSGEHCVVAKHTQTCLFNEWRGIFAWTFDLHAIFFKSLKEQITTSFRRVPFVLVDSGSGNSTGMVHVKLDGATQPLPLTTVYHKLVPVESTPYTLFQTIIGNGYPIALLDEEKILPIGKEITAVGLCRANKGSVEISSCPEIPFFLSELTKDDIEAELASRAKTLFWASVVLGTMSVSLLGYAIYRCRERLKERRLSRQAQELFHQANDDIREDGSSDDESGEIGDGQLCVICLVPPLESNPHPSSPATMSKYGTIPTSSSSAGAPTIGGVSPLDFISRAKARGATALATRRPWRELADLHAVGLPPSLGDAYLRVRANLAHFAMNYAIVVLVVVFLSLLWHPVSLIVFLVCMVAWLVLYFLRDEPIVLFGRVVGDGAILAVLAVLTLGLLLLTNATANILSSLLIGLVLVVLHAALHKAEDNVDDEVGRWYAPVPPPPSH